MSHLVCRNETTYTLHVFIYLGKVHHCTVNWSTVVLSTVPPLHCQLFHHCRTPKRLQPSSAADEKVRSLTDEVAASKRKSRMEKV